MHDVSSKTSCIDWLRCLHCKASSASRPRELDSPHIRRSIGYSPAHRGAPNGLAPKLVSLADLADRLRAEVDGGQSAETIVNGSTFDAFFTAGSAFAKTFDEACPEPPSSVGPAGESSSLPSYIGFTPVGAPGT